MMKTKICTKCGIEKDSSDFHKDKHKSDGYRPDCKSCSYNKSKNKIEISQLFNDGKIKCTKCCKELEIIEFYKKKDSTLGHRRICKQCGKNYDKENKYHILETHKIYNNLKRKTDISFRLTCNLRTRLCDAVKRNSKNKRTLELLGCTVEFLKQHLESKFTKGMSWDNYGDWHIDHKKPCARFDLSKPDEQRKCFNYTNLQPLWAIDNFRKSDKFIEKENIQ